MESIRFRDLPSFIRTIDTNDIMVNYILGEIRNTFRASALIFNTFDPLEKDVLKALSSMFPRLYTIGPLQLLLNQITDTGSNQNDLIGSSLWKEESDCLKWLDLQDPCSVLYVNFGSIAMLSSEQVVEFAWGLANSQKTILMGSKDRSCLWPFSYTATRICGTNPRKRNVRRVGTTGESIDALCSRRVLDTLRMELNFGELMWRCTRHLLAILR